eukprot:UN19460
MWNLKDLKAIDHGSTELHNSTVLDVQFNRLGSKLMSIGGDKTTKFWNIKTVMESPPNNEAPGLEPITKQKTVIILDDIEKPKIIETETKKMMIKRNSK